MSLQEVCQYNLFVVRLVSILPIRTVGRCRQRASVREPYTVRSRRIQYDDLHAQVHWVAILCEHLLILAEHPERLEFAPKFYIYNPLPPAPAYLDASNTGRHICI